MVFQPISICTEGLLDDEKNDCPLGIILFAGANMEGNVVEEMGRKRGYGWITINTTDGWCLPVLFTK